jgi:hypothetical protein
MKDVKTSISGELFIHKILWECCERHCQTAEKANAEKTGPIYYELTAMLMAFLTYEAYINFLGERVAPEAWKNERVFFNRHPYRGIAGKLKKICETCNIRDFEIGKRPYQTVVELCQLRNYLSHGKPDKYEKEIKHSRDNEPVLFHSSLYDFVTPTKVKRARKDVRAFIEFLHSSASPYVADPMFGDKPLGGIIEHAQADTTSMT